MIAATAISKTAVRFTTGASDWFETTTGTRTTSSASTRQGATQSAHVWAVLLRSGHDRLSAATCVQAGLALSDTVQRRIRVNPILCNGYGYCAEIVPELYWLDDWGFPIVSTKSIEGDRVLHLAERAVATCPRLALRLETIQPDAQ